MSLNCKIFGVLFIILSLVTLSSIASAKVSATYDDFGMCNPLLISASLNDATLLATINSTTLPDCTNKKVLLITPGTWVIDTNLTIPSRITTQIACNADVAVASGITLTLNGPVIECDDNWHSGLGTVVFNVHQERLTSAFISDGCKPPVPSASLTIPNLTCDAFGVDNSESWTVHQPAANIIIPDSPTVWLGIFRESGVAPSGWTSVAGTHYIHQSVVAQPVDPDGGLVVAQITVAASVISAIVDYRPLDSIYDGKVAGDLLGVFPGSIDQTARLEAAMAVLSNNPREHTIVLKAGIYPLGTLTMVSNVSIEGVSSSCTSGTILFQSTTANNLAIVEFDGVLNSGLSHLCIDGNSNNATGGQHDGGLGIEIRNPNTANITIDDVFLFDIHHRAIEAENVDGLILSDIRIDTGCDSSCVVMGPQDAADTFQNVLVTNMRIENAIGDGFGLWRRFETGTMRSVTIDNLRIKNVGLSLTFGHGLWNHNASDVNVSNLYIDTLNATSSSNGIHMEAGARFRFSNVYITDCAANGEGILLAGGTFGTVQSFSMTNFEISECSSGINMAAFGSAVDTRARDVSFTNGVVHNNDDAGLDIACLRCFFTNIVAFDNGGVGGFGFRVDGDSGSSTKASEVHCTSCRAYESAANTQDSGFRVGAEAEKVYISNSRFTGSVLGLDVNGSSSDELHGQTISMSLRESVAAATDYTVPLMGAWPDRPFFLANAFMTCGTTLAVDATNYSIYNLKRCNADGTSCDRVFEWRHNTTAITAFDLRQYDTQVTIAEQFFDSEHTAQWVKTHAGTGAAESDCVVMLEIVPH